jgi:hypothetical protein
MEWPRLNIISAFRVIITRRRPAIRYHALLAYGGGEKETCGCVGVINFVRPPRPGPGRHPYIVEDSWQPTLTRPLEAKK